MLNISIMNWQHIAEWYRNYLQVTHGPVSSYISSCCIFQCTRTRPASHSLYLKRTRCRDPSSLPYYVRVPVSCLTGSRVIISFLIFAAMSAALSADIAYNYSVCLLHITSRKTYSCVDLIIAKTTTDKTQWIRWSGTVTRVTGVVNEM